MLAAAPYLDKIIELVSADATKEQIAEETGLSLPHVVHALEFIRRDSVIRELTKRKAPRNGRFLLWEIPADGCHYPVGNASDNPDNQQRFCGSVEKKDFKHSYCLTHMLLCWDAHRDVKPRRASHG